LLYVEIILRRKGRSVSREDANAVGTASTYRAAVAALDQTEVEGIPDLHLARRLNGLYYIVLFLASTKYEIARISFQLPWNICI
jgi:hypothetical protein